MQEAPVKPRSATKLAFGGDVIGWTVWRCTISFQGSIEGLFAAGRDYTVTDRLHSDRDLTIDHLHSLTPHKNFVIAAFTSDLGTL